MLAAQTTECRSDFTGLIPILLSSIMFGHDLYGESMAILAPGKIDPQLWLRLDSAGGWHTRRHQGSCRFRHWQAQAPLAY